MAPTRMQEKPAHIQDWIMADEQKRMPPLVGQERWTRIWLTIMRTLYPLGQVDGEYEDWMEVLRLIYHGGACLYEVRGMSRIIYPHMQPS